MIITMLEMTPHPHTPAYNLTTTNDVKDSKIYQYLEIYSSIV